MKQNEKALSEFRKKVFAATKKIPRGKVTTYKLLAEAIQCRSSRAIGQALKHNPFAPRVPCHRVIRTDLTLGGFAGRTSGPELTRKKQLLKKEGVRIRNNRLADPAQLYTF